jgi:hypothetical protein
VIINLLKDSCSLQNERANLIHARKAQTSHLRSESTAIFGIGLRKNSFEPDFTSQSCKKNSRTKSIKNLALFYVISCCSFLNSFARRSSYLRKKRSLSTSQRPLSYIKSLLIIYSDENSKREQSWLCFLTVKRLTQVYYFSK